MTDNKPVAWILNGILHEFDPSDWAKEQYPDQDVIPLYTHPHPDNLGIALSIIDQQKLEIEAMRKDYMILAGKYQDALLELKF